MAVEPGCVCPTCNRKMPKQNSQILARISKPCVRCGKEMSLSPSKKLVSYCSNECRLLDQSPLHRYYGINADINKMVVEEYRASGKSIKDFADVVKCHPTMLRKHIDKYDRREYKGYLEPGQKAKKGCCAEPGQTVPFYAPCNLDARYTVQMKDGSCKNVCHGHAGLLERQQLGHIVKYKREGE